MHKKFEIDQTKIKGSCQSGRKVVTHDSMSDLPLSKSETPPFPLIFLKKDTNIMFIKPYTYIWHLKVGGHVVNNHVPK